MRKIAVVILSVALVFSQGCVAFWSSVAGYAEADSKYSKQYEDYKVEIEEVNTDRAENGLEPEKIQDFKEWIIEQPLSYSEIKVFKLYGVISDEDAKELRQKLIDKNSNSNSNNFK